MFLKWFSDVIALKLSTELRILKTGSFPVCWQSANINPGSKCPLSPLEENYRPISISFVLSKVHERQFSVRLWWVFRIKLCFASHQYAFRKGLGMCDAIINMSHVLQATLEGGSEARLVQIDYSTTYDRINHFGVLY